jgi:hypothetical protein
MERRWEPPSDYYAEQLKDVDERLVSGIATRGRLSNGKPGLPPMTYLDHCAQPYGLPGLVLHRTSAWLYQGHSVLAQVEPDQFKRFVPIMIAEQR